jgi:hypothetical protein
MGHGRVVAPRRMAAADGRGGGRCRAMFLEARASAAIHRNTRAGGVRPDEHPLVHSFHPDRSLVQRCAPEANGHESSFTDVRDLRGRPVAAAHEPAHTSLLLSTLIHNAKRMTLGLARRQGVVGFHVRCHTRWWPNGLHPTEGGLGYA